MTTTRRDVLAGVGLLGGGLAGIGQFFTPWTTSQEYGNVTGGDMLTISQLLVEMSSHEGPIGIVGVLFVLVGGGILLLLGGWLLYQPQHAKAAGLIGLVVAVIMATATIAMVVILGVEAPRFGMYLYLAAAPLGILGSFTSLITARRIEPATRPGPHTKSRPKVPGRYRAGRR